jgi:hypothetical protein
MRSYSLILGITNPALIDVARVLRQAELKFKKGELEETAAALEVILDKIMALSETFDEAEKHFRAQMMADIWLLIANIHERQNNFAGAITVYNQRIAKMESLIDDSDEALEAIAETYKKVGLLQWQLNEFDLAKDAMEEGAKLIAGLCDEKKVESYDEWLFIIDESKSLALKAARREKVERNAERFVEQHGLFSAEIHGIKRANTEAAENLLDAEEKPPIKLRRKLSNPFITK